MGAEATKVRVHMSCTLTGCYKPESRIKIRKYTQINTKPVGPCALRVNGIPMKVPSLELGHDDMKHKRVYKEGLLCRFFYLLVGRALEFLRRGAFIFEVIGAQSSCDLVNFLDF